MSQSGMSAAQAARLFALTLPAVCAEGGNVQPALGTQRASGVVGPSIAYCHGEVYALAAHYHLVSTQHLGFGHVPLAVGASQYEARQIVLDDRGSLPCGVAKWLCMPSASTV